MNEHVVAVILVSLSRFSFDQILSMNMALTLGNMVPKENEAYELALKLTLINKEGRPSDIESLKKACSIMIQRAVPQ